jgi:hypothetical protein
MKPKKHNITSPFPTMADILKDFGVKVKVKQYVPAVNPIYGSCMREIKNGDYVSFKDYLTKFLAVIELQEEVKRLKKKLWQARRAGGRI